jgi:CheY-like chemotaxis protein/anti-sigma regulatory factor (Ser/Thr protein kinase)
MKSIRQYLKNIRLLCVDDSADMQYLYKSFFENLFKEVIYAYNGEEGLEAFKNNEIHIILTAYAMPKMNGLEMTEKIRQIKHSVPIILATSYDKYEVLIQALQVNVNNFIHKPFDPSELFDMITKVTKILIAEDFLKKQREKELVLLKERKAYSNYQEELSFQKELKILRNDFYYRLSSENLYEQIYLVDFLYSPLDTLSGDAYSARQLPNGIDFFLLVDGMGKGISAAMSAMLTTAFVNYRIDNAIRYKSKFSLQECIEKTISHMQKLLLEDEILSVTFAAIDTINNNMEYASFSMPAILLMDEDYNIKRVSSNNAPLNAYYNPINITQVDLHSIKKILIYSDGIPENSIALNDETYEAYIEEDFKNSMTREDLKQLIQSRITAQEDDMSFILINHLSLNEKRLYSEKIPATLKAVENSQEWFSVLIQQHASNEEIINNAILAFNELLMNAYEHGSLKISSSQKEQLIENNTYFETLLDREVKLSLEIRIDIEHITNSNNEQYLLTIISDEGEGFDTEILRGDFGIKKNFNGRGIFMSRNATHGIYYNRKANSVIFFIKL